MMARRVITDKPGAYEWRDDWDRGIEHASIDDTCNACPNPVGWSTDGGGPDREDPSFWPYLISPDGRKKWCEDCALRYHAAKVGA